MSTVLLLSTADTDLLAARAATGATYRIGNPTRVEASIGKLFLDGGLEAAFAWMDAELVPLFRRQIAKR